MFILTASGFNDTSPRTLADNLGLDYAELINCSAHAEQYEVDSEIGDDLGVRSTPTLMVRYNDGPLQWITTGNQRYDGGGVPLSVLGNLIEANQ